MTKTYLVGFANSRGYLRYICGLIRQKVLMGTKYGSTKEASVVIIECFATEYSQQ